MDTGAWQIIMLDNGGLSPEVWTVTAGPDGNKWMDATYKDIKLPAITKHAGQTLTFSGT